MSRPDTRGIWNANAAAWTELSRGGFDVYRDLVNTPAFFAMLSPVEGLTCLDLGCGEGHNTRLLAGRGAQVVALDIAESRSWPLPRPATRAASATSRATGPRSRSGTPASAQSPRS